jgi:glycosyltransferase involved in cell wall biosynthesis
MIQKDSTLTKNEFVINFDLTTVILLRTVCDMKMMLFCWAQEIPNEILAVSKYLSQLDHQFIVTPLIRFKDKMIYADSMLSLSQKSDNIIVAPIYLKSANSSLTNFLNPNTFMRDFLSIRKVIKKNEPDVIVCFYLSHAYPLVLLKKMSNFSLCVVAMGSDVNLENSFLQRKAREVVYRNSELIFARSWSLKEKIEKDHEKDVIVSPSSTDTSFFKPLESKSSLREKWNLNLTDRIVLTVCRLDKNKGVDILLKSMDLLQNIFVKLIIIGDGEERKNLETLSSTLGLDDKVLFMGQRSKLELLELYNLSDAFLLASYSEGLPRTVLEAMACGCIPIATNVGSVGKIITDGQNGFLTEPGNHVGFSEGIKKMFTLPSEDLKQMQTKARESVIRDFDSGKVWKTMVNTIFDSASEAEIE